MFFSEENYFASTYEANCEDSVGTDVSDPDLNNAFDSTKNETVEVVQKLDFAVFKTQVRPEEKEIFNKRVFFQRLRAR